MVVHVNTNLAYLFGTYKPYLAVCLYDVTMPQIMRISECTRTVLKLMQVTLFVREILEKCVIFLGLTHKLHESLDLTYMIFGARINFAQSLIRFLKFLI